MKKKKIRKEIEYQRIDTYLEINENDEIKMRKMKNN